MKTQTVLKLTVLLMSLGILSSCSKEEAVQLIGEWELTEVLYDPGDGSGTFQSVASNKTIEFFGNGTVTSNGNLCQASTDSNSPSSGTYSTVDQTINSTSCTSAHSDIVYELDVNNLIINYPCIEPCRAKFEKIN